MMELFDSTAFECSELITKRYSTSFTLGIKTLHKKYRAPIYAVYGFVRYADEIVDTFHDHDKEKLLGEFQKDTYRAIGEGISLNPILHSFQKVVNKYGIRVEYIKAFLKSMEMDLHELDYSDDKYKEYIYGSAEVVGLMCVQVFCEGNHELFERLIAPARSLGSAFQKVNFLRDIKSDFEDRGRVYFPGVDFKTFTNKEKNIIEEDIKQDFKDAYQGILNLPKGSKPGVYLAYIYYYSLFRKIQKMTPITILQERIRIPDGIKLLLWLRTYVKVKLNLI